VDCSRRYYAFSEASVLDRISSDALLTFTRARVSHITELMLVTIWFILGDNSALHPSGVAKSSASFGWGKGWNVTSAGWQVTLCDPILHVSSSSGVATSVSELLYPCYFTLLY